MNAEEIINYAKYGATTCLALGGLLMFIRSWGCPIRWCTLIGGGMAIGVYFLTVLYTGDWRLYVLQGFGVIPGYAGTILSGVGITLKAGEAYVKAATNPREAQRRANKPYVPVNPPSVKPTPKQRGSKPGRKS